MTNGELHMSKECSSTNDETRSAGGISDIGRWAFGHWSFFRHSSLVLSHVLVLLLLGSCQMAGFAGANFLPEAKVKAVYTPIDQKTLVFVDDPRNALPSAQLAGLIAQTISRDLQDHEIISEFVVPSALDDLRARERDFEVWPIDQIGQSVGARQVIYLLIDGFEPGGRDQELQRPMASARLKVVDVASGKPLFPVQGEHGLTSTLSFKQPPLDADSHGRNSLIARQLAQRLGGDTAQQFYDHKRREIGSGFEE